MATRALTEVLSTAPPRSARLWRRLRREPEPVTTGSVAPPVEATEEPTPQSSSDGWPRGGWILGLLVAALATLALLWRKSFWTDEALALDRAARPVSDTLHDLVHHDLSRSYEVALAGVSRIDTGEWAARLPSAIAVILAAACMYALGIRLFGRLEGTVATLFLALNAGVVAVGQQALPYASAVFAVVLATLLLVRSLERGGWVDWTLYALVAVTVPFTHPIAASVLVAHACAAVVFSAPGETKGRWQAAIALPAVGLVAFVLAVMAVQRSRIDEGVASPSARELFDAAAFAAGNNPLLVIAALGGLGYVCACLRTRDGLWRPVLVAGMILGPPVALLVADPVIGVHADQALVVSAPGLALGAAAGVGALWHYTAVRVALALVLAAGFGAVVVWLDDESREDWRAAVARVSELRGANDSVVVVPHRSRAAALAYDESLTPIRFARGDRAFVLVVAPDAETAIRRGRRVVATPRYALAASPRFGDDLFLQRWVRP